MMLQLRCTFKLAAPLRCMQANYYICRFNLLGYDSYRHMCHTTGREYLLQIYYRFSDQALGAGVVVLLRTVNMLFSQREVRF